MKKQYRLLIAAAAVAAMAGGYLWLTREQPAPVQETASEAPAEEPEFIYRNNRSDIAKVVITHRGEDPLEIIPEAASWTMDVDYPEEELITSLINSAGISAVQLIADRTIEENPEDLSVYGLDDPGTTVRIVMKDGSEQTLYIGNKNPAGNKYYVMTDASPAVYTAIHYGIRSFDIHYDELRNRDVPTGIDQKNIAYVKLIHDGEQAEIVPALENDPDIIGSVPTEFKVVSDLPVQRVHNQNYAELREAVPPVIRIRDFIDDNPSNYGIYGLGSGADEILFKDTDSSFSLKIGDKTESGTYYAVLNDDKKVVTLDASIVEKLFAFSAFDLIDRFILLVSINVVDSIELEVDGNSYSIEITREEIEGEEEPKERFFINRLEIEDKAFRTFYQELIGPVADTLNLEETSLKNPEIRIEYTLNKGTDRTPAVEYVKVDRDFYAPFVNGKNTYLVSTEQVQDIKTALEIVLKSVPQ